MNKKILLSAILTLSGSLAKAQAHEIQLSQRTVQLAVDISTAKLKWSKADYPTAVVKVLVPELADVTILDHRNTGEGAPCLATYEAMSPEEVIQNNPSTEQVPTVVTLTKILSPDPDNQLCHVTLSETVETKIRGFKFEHLRTLNVGDRHIDDCR